MIDEKKLAQKIMDLEIAAAGVNAIMARNLVLETALAGLMQVLTKAGTVQPTDLRAMLNIIAGQFPAEMKGDPGAIAANALIQSLDQPFQAHAEKAFPHRPRDKRHLQ